jgi:hypothetical protein
VTYAFPSSKNISEEEFKVCDASSSTSMASIQENKKINYK